MLTSGLPVVCTPNINAKVTLWYLKYYMLRGLLFFTIVMFTTGTAGRLS